MIHLLVDCGADVDNKNKYDNSPVALVFSSNSLDAVRLLIDRGSATEGIDLNWTEDRPGT